jgi:ABC-2 type transport system permease protein
LSTATLTPLAGNPAGAPLRTVRPLHQASTFLSVLWRDIFTTGREILPFLAQVVVQPLFSLLIFGKILADLGYTSGVFGQILLPGLVALNAFLTGLQSTALPLVLDFSFTREIEDRLLSPMSMGLVAAEKMVFGALRGLISGLFIVPLGLWLLHVSWPLSVLLPVIGVLFLGALVGAALGMTLGTLVSSRRIEIMLTVILTPLIFTGSTQFPWRAIAGVPWFQDLCAVNPCTYVSEAMRALIAPHAVRSIPLWLDALILLVALLIFGGLGIFGFRRRALD